jgi:hypothetical protein
MDQATSPLSMGGPCSKYSNVNIGVSHRDPLCTHHFNNFIDNLVEPLLTQPRKAWITCVSYSNSQGFIASLTQADDVAAPSLTAFRLYCHIILISNWMKQNGCRPNVDKSKFIIFIPDVGLAIPTFVMGRQNVERVSTFEPRGPVLRKGQLGHTHHIRLLQRMNRAFSAWYPIFICNKLPVSVPLMVVHTFCLLRCNILLLLPGTHKRNVGKIDAKAPKHCVQCTSCMKWLQLGEFCLGIWGCFLHHWPYNSLNWVAEGNPATFKRNAAFRLRITSLGRYWRCGSSTGML